jgi:hypothetical protein
MMIQQSAVTNEDLKGTARASIIWNKAECKPTKTARDL